MLEPYTDRSHPLDSGITPSASSRTDWNSRHHASLTRGVLRCGVPETTRSGATWACACGGAHVLTNLRIACSTCNLRKNAKDPAEWIETLAA